MSSLIEELYQSHIDNPGTPYCAKCFYNAYFESEFELDEDGNLSCPNCGLVIEVEGISK